SFAPPLQNLNIVGLDQDGEARIYWWNANTGWQVNSVSAGVPNADIPRTPWTLTWSNYNVTGGGSERVSTQSLLGLNDAGDLVRLVWRSNGPDAWVLENVTEMSLPYVI